MRLISINVAQPRLVSVDGETYETAIYNEPVARAYLHRLNFDGDRQADLSVHGGPDKAVYSYSFDHYPHWETFLGRKLQPGAMGENLTIEGWDEREICIGDTYQIGEAQLQISQPRQPCFKFGDKMGRADALKEMIHTGFACAYLRVVGEGLVKTGDAVELLHRHPAGLTVAYACRVEYFHADGTEGLRRLIAVKELSAGWRRRAGQKLARLGR